MNRYIGQIAIVVRDYDEAIRFYCEILNFELLEDSVLNDTKRWVVVAPAGNNGAGLLLAKASGNEQTSRIGNQTGGRVFLFLYTDDIDRDYKMLISKGVVFVRPLSLESYGKVAVFQDLYGNLWDLIEKAPNP
ncbi:MAG: VOC family protein [Saprospiraceae bacterium]|nr:VOC family protein [Saprospiraceae bacterium]